MEQNKKLTQQEADSRIEVSLRKYLSNNSNSISGNNFPNMIKELMEIENEWEENVVRYLEKIELN